MEKKPKVAILSGFGINCQIETSHAFSLAGAEAKIIHLNDFLCGEEHFSNYHCIAFPGGFSFGDDISSGKVYGNKIRTRLWDQLLEFIDEEKLIIGICNGFQTLVKIGLLPNISGTFTQEATLFSNASGRFEDRWVYLTANPKSRCIFTKGITRLYLPVRHGEGQFIVEKKEIKTKLKDDGYICLQYTDSKGNLAPYPSNPNGSEENIAGICDKTGRIFGLMPHPECHIFFHHHPRWTRGEGGREIMGINIFENAVRYMKGELL
ncbi:MAG: phosphoribosylformylglycinamidine synthase I [Candidatus Anstonellales archaeon]